MDDKLENLRNFFPAEVTGAYLSLKGVLSAQGYGPSDFDYPMVGVIALLALVNVWVYWRFRSLTNWIMHAILALGFVLWAVNMDIPRFRDILLIGQNIELVAPVCLIMYVLITGFVTLPKATDH